MKYAYRNSKDNWWKSCDLEELTSWLALWRSGNDLALDLAEIETGKIIVYVPYEFRKWPEGHLILNVPEVN